MNNKIFLIIDDDEDDRMFFKDAIQELAPSAVCLEANGSVEAISLLHHAKQLPYCIFLDINMPSIDGRECLEFLKNDSLLKHIMVIMYSTSSSDKSIKEFLTLGAAGYLNKPTDLNQLPAHILTAIKSINNTV
ncbi:MAG: response regulator [Ferruginibacter sp.]